MTYRPCTVWHLITLKTNCWWHCCCQAEPGRRYQNVNHTVPVSQHGAHHDVVDGPSAYANVPEDLTHDHTEVCDEGGYSRAVCNHDNNSACHMPWRNSPSHSRIGLFSGKWQTSTRPCLELKPLNPLTKIWHRWYRQKMVMGQKIKVYVQLLFIPIMSKFNEKFGTFLSILLNVGDVR